MLLLMNVTSHSNILLGKVTFIPVMIKSEYHLSDFILIFYSKQIAGWFHFSVFYGQGCLMTTGPQSWDINKIVQDQSFSHNMAVWQTAVLFDDKILILTGRRWPWPSSLSSCCTLPGSKAWAHSASLPLESSLLNTSEVPQQGHTAAQQPSAGSLRHRQEMKALD